MSLGLSQSALPAELMRGCRLKQNFRDKASMLRDDWTLFGNPVVNQGLELDGATQWATRLLAGELDSPKLTFHLGFYPTFEADDGVAHRIIDSTLGAPGRVLFYKDAAGVLLILVGNTTLSTIPLAVYEAYWITNGRNVLSVSATAGANIIWLNKIQIATSAIAWTEGACAELSVGGSIIGGNLTSATYSRLYIGHHTSTLQEHVDIWNNATWDWENELLCNLQFRTRDFDPTNVRTLDSSGHGNHAQLGDGTPGPTNPTQGRGRMEGDGAQYWVVPADASLPAGTYTVLMADKGRNTVSSGFLFDARAGGGVGYAYIDGATDKIIFTFGALFVNGAGPYTSNVYVINEAIRSVVFQGITLDIATQLVIFCRNTFINFQTGSLFDFKIAADTLTPTQILDYHRSQMDVIGAQI